MPGMQTRPVAGILMVIAAAVLWGTTGTAQSLASGTLDPLWFGALRMAVAATFFAALAALAPRAPGGARLPLAALAGAGFCMAAYNLAFFAGVRLAGVGVGTALALGSGPIWAGILEALVAGRAPAAPWWLGTALAVTGGALLVAPAAGAPLPATPAGVALCLASGLAYAAYSLISKRVVATVRAEVATLWTFTAAALIALPAAALTRDAPVIAPADAWAVLYVGVVTAGIAYLLFSHALTHISAATGVTLALIEPAVAFALAVTLIGERPGVTALPGLLLITGGVLLVVRAELRAVRRNPA